jgi:hypothetical protein
MATKMPTSGNTETPNDALAITITQVSVADGPILAATNIPAFWADPHWRLEWRHRTLDYHISQVALRYPRNLLRNRATARHQKAVDTATGKILGYARWSIPASHATITVTATTSPETTSEDTSPEKEGNGTPAWPEALVPAVSAEEEAEISRVADTAVWDPDFTSDPLLDGVREIEKEILGRKAYMSMIPSLPHHTLTQTRTAGIRIPKNCV